MNSLTKLIPPPRLALVLGIPSLALMALLMMTGRDDRGLLIPGHFAGVLLWILTAVMIGLTVLSLRPYHGKARHNRMFPASTAGAAGIFGAALGMFGEAWRIWCAGSGALDLSAAALGMIAGFALLYLAWCRFRGSRGSFLLWSMVTGFLMLRLLLCYRDWSAQSELLRYCFPLFASVCITLAYYHRAAFSLDVCNRRLYLFLTQMGAFFCLISLGAGFDLFHLGMLAWCLLDLPSMRSFKSAAREKNQEDQP